MVSPVSWQSVFTGLTTIIFSLANLQDSLNNSFIVPFHLNNSEKRHGRDIALSRSIQELYTGIEQNSEILLWPISNVSSTVMAL